MLFVSGKKVHCIGIKGAGMTAFAQVLARRGVFVTGSDIAEVFFTDSVLRQENIPFIEGFSPENIPANADIIVYSTAYRPETNAELRAAFSKNVPVMSYPEAIGELMREYFALAVCGTHGKTTTSALLAEVLRVSGEDPVAVVGSTITQWGGNALSGSGKYFVLEADEYQNKLQHYHPFGMIVTSVDWDHPDFFPDIASYEKVFADAIGRLPAHGVLVVCGDASAPRKIAENARCRRVTYGFLKENDVRIVNHSIVPSADFVEQDANDGFGAVPVRQSFELLRAGVSLGIFRLRLAGKHNALNAAAVVALCDVLKIDIEKVREGLLNFYGTARRFERIGEYSGALLYDDYAHHPEEIKATLRAFREVYPNRRLRAIFHPHTFTRTKALLSDFAQSFDDADSVLVLDIYGSAREKQGGVSSADLVSRINSFSQNKAEHIGTVSEAIEKLKKTIAPGDLAVTLGAGNVWEITHSLAKKNIEMI